MASNICDFCDKNIIGITSLNQKYEHSHQQHQICPISIGQGSFGTGATNRKDRIFNMGSDQYVGTEGEAADIILKRNFPDTLELKDVNKATFQPGKIGVIKVPKIFLSEIPHISEPNEYENLSMKKSGKKLTKEEKDVIKKETAERVVLEGLFKYFDSKEEDLYIFTNQYLRKKTYWEKDALIVNLTRGYILVIEAKTYLTKRKFIDSSDSSYEKAKRQMRNTFDIVKNYISKNLQRRWKLVRIIYATEIGSDMYVCPSCNPFVISRMDGKFDSQIKEILDQSGSFDVKDWSYANDFYTIVRKIIPKELKIAGDNAGIIDISINNRTIKAIRKNVNKA